MEGLIAEQSENRINSSNLSNNLSNIENSNEWRLFNNLEKIWTNEKFCKELLSYDENTIDAVITKIEKRVNKILNFK